MVLIDREFRYGNRFVLPDRLVLARRRIEDVEHAVLSEERSEGLAISEGHNPNFLRLRLARGAEGLQSPKLGNGLSSPRGDLVLTFNKTIDLMRQDLRNALPMSKPDHPLIRTLRQAESLLRRDIVEQSLILGFPPLPCRKLPLTARASKDYVAG